LQVTEGGATENRFQAHEREVSEKRFSGAQPEEIQNWPYKRTFLHSIRLNMRYFHGLLTVVFPVLYLLG
jgi:hypothetical protein